MKQLYDIWFAHIMGVNCSNGGRIAQSGFGPRFYYNCRDSLKQFNIFTERQTEAAAITSLEDVEDIYRIHTENSIKSVNYNDGDFPERLKSIPHMPLVIFYKGDLNLLKSEYTVGIVGSRRCNGEGEQACNMIAEEIAQLGGVVVSGLAQGIDTIAHKAAVNAGGRTVAFLGTPLNEYFPKTNIKFQDKLCAEHLVISEYYCTYPYYSANFIARNRLIAAASDALCVVQAKERSGSLATVNRAVEYDKPVFTVPGSIFSPAYSGSNKLLVDGIAKAVTKGSQIMEYLGYTPQTEGVQEQPIVETPALDEISLAVLNAIDGQMNTNTIIRTCGLKAAIVKAALTALEMDGWIKHTDSGEYIRTK